jgi:hypothetical protein
MDNKHLIIDSRPYGFFSIFLHTIDNLKWAEDNNYKPHIICTDSNLSAAALYFNPSASCTFINNHLGNK